MLDMFMCLTIGASNADVRQEKLRVSHFFLVQYQVNKKAFSYMFLGNICHISGFSFSLSLFLSLFSCGLSIPTGLPPQEVEPQLLNAALLAKLAKSHTTRRATHGIGGIGGLRFTYFRYFRYFRLDCPFSDWIQWFEKLKVPENFEQLTDTQAPRGRLRRLSTGLPAAGSGTDSERCPICKRKDG
jgi:hypothetical protein